MTDAIRITRHQAWYRRRPANNHIANKNRNISAVYRNHHDLLSIYSVTDA